MTPCTSRWQRNSTDQGHRRGMCEGPATEPTALTHRDGCAMRSSSGLQLTVCAHFLPDMSMSGPTSPGNMSASAADTPTCDSGPDADWVARIRPASLGGRASFTLQQQRRNRSQTTARGSTADHLNGLGGETRSCQDERQTTVPDGLAVMPSVSNLLITKLSRQIMLAAAAT